MTSHHDAVEAVEADFGGGSVLAEAGAGAGAAQRTAASGGQPRLHRVVQVQVIALRT